MPKPGCQPGKGRSVMKSLDRRNGALVLVDYQQRLLPALHGGARAVDEALFLARLARLLGLPVMATEQNPAGLGPVSYTHLVLHALPPWWRFPPAEPAQDSCDRDGVWCRSPRA